MNKRAKEDKLEMVLNALAETAAQNPIPALEGANVTCRPRFYGAMSSPSVVAARGYGDVDEIAIWRVAELRTQGIDAKIKLLSYTLPSGATGYTCRIVLPDGTEENPETLVKE